LTEGNAAAWGTFAQDGSASVSNDSSNVKVGAQSLKFTTTSGGDTGVRYPRTGEAHLDLTSKTHFSFYAYGVNPHQHGFQFNQPVVDLKFAGGSYRYTPTSMLMSNNAWGFYNIPLAGNSQWVRTTTGAPVLSDLLQLEIHQDTWDWGFSAYYDGVRFTGPSDAGDWATPPPPPGVNGDTIKPRVLLYCFDPIMENLGGKRMHESYWGFQNPVTLTNQIVSALQTASHGMVQYQVVETKVVDAHPYFSDGFRHTDASFHEAWSSSNFYNGTFDYARFVRENNIAARIDSGDLDEVWIYAGPISGMYESAMGGQGNYWINGIANNIPTKRAFVMMGWNFERGLGEAIHSYGHRAESILGHSYGPWQQDQSNHWNKFALQNRQAPGLGGIGNVHFPVNGTFDYDYANGTLVSSNADDWATYPNFAGLKRTFGCAEWTPNRTDPQREYLSWWYSRMPHFAGMGTDGFLNNWWRYLADVDQFKAWNGNVMGTPNTPAVEILSPTNNASVAGMVNIKVDAGVEGALGRVDLYVDGVYHSTDTMAPFNFQWDASAQQGTHRLEAKAYELRYGREAVSTPVLVNVKSLLEFSATSYSVAEKDQNSGEGSVANITVTRSGDGTQPVTVEYAISDGNSDGPAVADRDYLATSGTLSFAAGETSKNFSVKLLNDALDEVSEMVNLRLSNPTNGAMLGTNKSAILFIIDDDPIPSLLMDDITVVEGDSGTKNAIFTARLSAPSGRYVSVYYETTNRSPYQTQVLYTATPGSDYVTSNGQLIFAPGVTSATIAVPIIGDARREADETFAINFSNYSYVAPPFYQNVCTITNDDTAGFDITPISDLVTSEDGKTTTFAVKLTSQPSANVALNMSSSHPGEGLVSPSTLTFTSTNWNVAQTVIITGVNDDVDDGDINYTIQTGAPISNDPDYASLTAASVPDVSVTNTDNDSAGITVSAVSGLNTSEDSGEATFSVKLATQPTANVMLNVSSSDETEGTISSGLLVFTPTNWNVAQTVTITGIDDSIVDGNINYAIRLGPVASDDINYKGKLVDDVPVTNTDNDSATLSLTVDASSVAEGGTITCAVRRNTSTAEALTVNLSSSNVAAATLPAVISIAQGEETTTFKITSVDDHIDDETQNSVLTASAQGFSSGTTNISVTDNDTAGITVNPVQGLTTSESGAQSTFAVVLTSQPTQDVSIELRSSNVAEGTVSPSSLVFNSQNWNTSQSVTLTGADDVVVDGAQDYRILTTALSTDAGYQGQEPDDVSVTNADNDTASLQLSINPATVIEGGFATAQLTRNMLGEMTVQLASNDTSEATVPATVVIPVGQTSASFSIRAEADSIADGDQVAIITATASTLSATANLTVQDSDTAGIVVTSPPRLETTEDGGRASFKIHLTSQPTAEVLIELSSSNPAEGSVTPASLSFNAQNWNQPQTATVTGTDDAVVDGAQNYSIITAARSNDPKYNGREVADVVAVNADNDVASLDLTLSVSTVGENAVAGVVTGTLTRNFRMDEAVTVALKSSLLDVTVPASASFAASATSTTFNVGMVNNSVAEGSRTAIITASVGTLSAEKSLAITDDDSPLLILTLMPSTIAENATTPVMATIARNTPTAAALTVALSSSNVSQATVPTSVTIPTGAVSATFAVTPIDDQVADGVQKSAIRAQAAGFSTPALAELTVTDDEKASLTLSFNLGRIAENGSAIATLKRNSVITTSTPSLAVTLAMNISGQVTAPSSISIPAGAATVSFTVNAVDDKQSDGPRIITLTARATGFLDGVGDVIVTDNERSSNVSINGKVTLPTTQGSSPVAGVALTLRQGTVLMDRVLTASNGTYSFSGVPVNSYSVTPEKSGYTFTPTSRAVTFDRKSTTAIGIDFVGTPYTQISGVLSSLKSDGSPAPLADVTIVARSSSGSFEVRTNRAGAYRFEKLPLGNYVVTPQKTGIVFRLRFRPVTITPATPIVNNVNFAGAGADAVPPSSIVVQPDSTIFTSATQSTLQVSGTATDNTGGSGVAKVTIAIGRFASASTTTLTGLWDWKNRSFITQDASSQVEFLTQGTTLWSLTPTGLAHLRSLPAGIYGIRATAIDNAGNEKRSAWKRFVITPNAPVEDTASISSVRLSTGAAKAATSSISLTFTGALHSSGVTDPDLYSVEVNGQTVEIESLLYNATTRTVVLSLPQSTLKSGNQVLVRWQKVPDTQSRLASGQAMLTAR
jgi:hypothetical protein